MTNMGKLLSRVAARWRREAEILHRRGADEQAVVLKTCASEVKKRAVFFTGSADARQAVEESGFSYSTLEKMVRDGTLPNVGKKGASHPPWRSSQEAGPWS